MIRTQINQASLSMFSRLFRYFRPVQFIQFIFKADHILLKHIVSRKIVLKRCFEMCAIEREVLEHSPARGDRIRWTAMYKMCSNWLTQMVTSEVDRRSRFNLNLMAVG